MKVCVCGGGNLAHAFAGELVQNSLVSEVNVLTRRPEGWGHSLDVHHLRKFCYTSQLNSVTNDYEVLRDMDLIIITIPSFARLNYIEAIKDYVPTKAMLMVAPSTGGINFIFEEFLPENKYVCLQRVPYICRIMERGHSVTTDIKKNVAAYFSKNCTDIDKNCVKSLLKMNIEELSSFWSLILSNSNPILHIAGVCEIMHLKEYPNITKKDLFYDTWSDYASQLCLDMDSELSKVMDYIGDNEFKNLLEYYEVSDATTLSNKLKNIPSFRDVEAPLVLKDDTYVIDTTSRYLIEDLPYGTCFIKYVAQCCGIATPNVDFAIKQIQSLLGQKYIDEKGNFNVELWNSILGFDINKYIDKEIKVMA